MQAATRRRLRRACALGLGAATLALLLFGVGRATGELPAAPGSQPTHAFA